MTLKLTINKDKCMRTIELIKEGQNYTLTLLQEGKFTDVFVNEVNEALNQIESDSSAKLLLITGVGKNFSQGFDIPFVLSCGDKAEEFIDDSLRMLSRFLKLGIPTVAAINGHAFGIGAVLALACDFRCMRIDRGYFCLPEVNLNMGLPPLMNGLIKVKLSPSVARECLLSGKRFSGEEAFSKGIVDKAVDEESLLTESINLLADYLGKDRVTYANLKLGLNEELIELTP